MRSPAPSSAWLNLIPLFLLAASLPLTRSQTDQQRPAPLESKQCTSHHRVTDQKIALRDGIAVDGCDMHSPPLATYVSLTSATRDLLKLKSEGVEFTDLSYIDCDGQIAVISKDPPALFQFNTGSGKYEGATRLSGFGELDGVAWVAGDIVAVLEGTRAEIIYVDIRHTRHEVEAGKRDGKFQQICVPIPC